MHFLPGSGSNTRNRRQTINWGNKGEVQVYKREPASQPPTTEEEGKRSPPTKFSASSHTHTHPHICLEDAPQVIVYCDWIESPWIATITTIASSTRSQYCLQVKLRLYASNVANYKYRQKGRQLSSRLFANYTRYPRMTIISIAYHTVHLQVSRRFTANYTGFQCEFWKTRRTRTICREQTKMAMTFGTSDVSYGFWLKSTSFSLRS